MLHASMPDITKAQVAAGLKFLFTLAAMLALPVSQHVQEVAIGSSGAIAATIVIADAVIRGNRAKALALVSSDNFAKMAEQAFAAARAGRPLDPVVGVTNVTVATDPGTPPPAFQPDAYAVDGPDGQEAPDRRPAALAGDTPIPAE